MNTIRVVFMGTPEFATTILQTLLDNDFNIVGVVTQPDKPVGRKKEIKYPPIKELAIKNNLKVIQPINIKQDYQEVLNLNPELVITCAYGQIIPKIILENVKYGCINVHASLLPKLRGGAPIHKAIIEGHENTGISIMEMISKMDAGKVYSQETIKIEDDDNVGTLHDKLSTLGAKLLIKTLPSIIDKSNLGVEQDINEVTFASNISREEERINWNNTTRTIFNQVRGLYPWPKAYTTLNDKQIKILKVSIGKSNNTNDTIINGTIIDLLKDSLVVKVNDGTILIEELQIEGKKAMSVTDYLKGNNKIKINDLFL